MSTRHRNSTAPARRRASKLPTAPSEVLVFSEGTPIYAQLIVHFRRQIETGAWEVGRNIPVLGDLASTYGVARETVRQALSFLEREGLIASRRGRGTTVLRKPRAELWFPIPRTWEELVASADSIVGEALELSVPVRLPPLPESGTGSLAPNYFAMRRLLKRDGVPYLIGTSYVDRRIFERMGEQALREVSVYRAMERAGLYKVVRAHQTVTLGTADAEAAYLLEVPLNAPLVIAVRWAFDEHETLVYQSEGRYRSDFVRVHRRLK